MRQPAGGAPTPGPEAAKAAAGHGSVEQAREHYTAEKKQATNQLNYSRNNLSSAFLADQVALDAVSDQTKLDLLNDAKTVAQENKERQKPSVRDALHQKEEGSQHDHDVSDDKSLRRSWQSSKVDKPSGGPALRSSSP